MNGQCQPPLDDLTQFDPRRYRRLGSHGSKSFWTKQRDGAVFVTLVRHRNQGGNVRAISVEVLDPVTHAVQHFGSLRQFWRSLGKTAPVSLARYMGKERSAPKTEGTLLDLLSGDAVVDTGAPKLGIDLVARGHEVKKLMWAGFGHKILRAGYDPDDVLQEVFRGIVARNHGTCPWDARKSSFGHYVHMVISCVLTNYHRKQQQVRGTEVLGLRGVDGEVGDAAAGAIVQPQAGQEDRGATLVDTLVTKLPEGLRDAGRRACAVLSDGGSHREAAKAAGLKASDFAALLAALRA